jgi:5-methylcytosine-specific restriction protein A
MATRAPVHRPVRLEVRRHGPDWSQPWAKAKPQQRLSGRKLQRERERLFAREPLCAECKRHDRATLAVWRDHIVPVAEGGTDDDANIQGLCDECHRAKTAREAARGLKRGR